jgi:hypothetical protein
MLVDFAARHGSVQLIARLQRGLLGLVVLLCLLILTLWSHRWPVTACVVAGLVAGVQVWVLGLQFWFMSRANRFDPVPAADAFTVVRAWALEVGHSWRVFCVRQPWRCAQYPNGLQAPAKPGWRGVLLVHGYFCNRGLWNPWMRKLLAQGRPFIALSLEPPFTSIDGYAEQIDQAVRQLTELTGLRPVVLAHSMGGLAVRAWWRASHERGDCQRVHHVITLGTPHRGTWLGRWAHTPNGQQMRLRSPWLQTLWQDEPEQRRAQFTCFYSDCDNIVFPTSTGRLSGADNRLLHGMPHVAMACAELVWLQVMALIESWDEPAASIQ